MPENERKQRLPDWAEQERFHDMQWIADNLAEFWEAAQHGFAEYGRGAVAADTTIQPEPDKGHPMYYIPQDQILADGTADEIRLVTQYDPTWELVAMVFKPQGRSSYRLGLPGKQLSEGGETHRR